MFTDQSKRNPARHWRARARAFFTLAALLMATVANAQSVAIPQLAAPPRLADFASSELSSAAREMVPIKGLVQRTPVDGALVSEPTVVYLGFDARHLYAVFVCANPTGVVRAHRVNRDRLPDDDDSVALHLDTFRDRRGLYGFQVNPAGVQVDGVYTEGKGWDLTFDAVWTAETIVQPERYLVLITVPFSSIRFPTGAEHEWGLFVYRGMPRKNEEAFWPAYSTRYQGRLAYAAQLLGLHDLEAGQPQSGPVLCGVPAAVCRSKAGRRPRAVCRARRCAGRFRFRF